MSKSQVLPIEKNNRRVTDDAAFVIRSWNWKETSLLVEFFTLKHGKVLAVAKGAKRPGSHFRGLLTEFSPLKIGYYGQNEVKTLSRAQWMGGFFSLEGEAIFSGFYLNELLVRLLPREETFEGLFGSYVQTLKNLAQQDANHEVGLRTFELDLLESLGYGLPDTGEDWYWDGEELKPCDERRLLSERHILIEHAMIDRLRQRDLRLKETQAFAKKLLREMITHYSGDRPLNTRRILQELRRA